MADLVVHSEREPGAEGSVLRVTPESAGWDWVGFEVVRLDAGQTLERETGSEEICLVVLSSATTSHRPGGEWRGVGERASPFDGPPHTAYLPPGRGIASRRRRISSWLSPPPQPSGA